MVRGKNSPDGAHRDPDAGHERQRVDEHREKDVGLQEHRRYGGEHAGERPQYQYPRDDFIAVHAELAPVPRDVRDLHHEENADRGGEHAQQPHEKVAHRVEDERDLEERPVLLVMAVPADEERQEQAEKYGRVLQGARIMIARVSGENVRGDERRVHCDQRQENGEDGDPFFL